MLTFARRAPFLPIAVLLSLLAHLLVLFGHRIDLSLPRTDLVPLEARLTRSAPAKQPGTAPKPDRPPQPSVPEPVAPETPQTAVAEAKDEPVAMPPPPQPEPEKKVEEKIEPQPEVPPAPKEPPKTAGNTWPRAGVIKYLLFGGEGRDISPDPSKNSTAELRWEILPDGRYSMKLESVDAQPFPSMPWFKVSMMWSSVGNIVDGRFQPRRYEESISVFQHIVVNLDWEKMQVDFSGHQLPMKPGTLDYLSVMMQAGDPGFVEAGTLSVATGRGLRQYQFESLGDTDLALPFGMTWKTKQLVGKTANNDVRVWVATEKFYLPVQIKFIVKKVNYYLVATEVLVAKDALAPRESAPAVQPAVTEK